MLSFATRPPLLMINVLNELEDPTKRLPLLRHSELVPAMTARLFVEPTASPRKELPATLNVAPLVTSSVVLAALEPIFNWLPRVVGVALLRTSQVAGPKPA